MTSFEVRVSLGSWTSRCALCGAEVVGWPGRAVAVAGYGNGTGDPVCDPCAERTAPALFALLEAERLSTGRAAA